MLEQGVFAKTAALRNSQDFIPSRGVTTIVATEAVKSIRSPG